MKKLISFIVLVFLIFSFSCKNKTKVYKEKEFFAPVIAYKVRKMKLRKILDLSGKMIPKEKVLIYPKIKGVIMKKLLVDIGDYVRKNQILALLEDDEIKAEIKRAKASLSLAIAKKNEILAELSKVEKDLKRYRTLYKKNVIPKQKLEQIETTYKTLLAKKDLAIAQINQAKATIEKLNVIHSYYFIKSPIYGRVSDRFLDEGSMMDTKVPILEIVNDNPLKVITYVNEEDIVYLRLNEKVEIKVDAYPNKVFIGRIKRISPAVDPKTHTGKIEIYVSNKKGLLKSGMYAHIRIYVREKLCLAIPLDSLNRIPGTGTYFVYIINSNIAHKRNIEIGVRDRGFVEVKKGLNLGDLIVKVGQGRLKSGVKVKIIKKL